MEEWKAIPEYEELYEVSSDGRVRSLNYRGTGKIREFSSLFGKREIYALYKKGTRKAFYIHQLVAMAFLAHIPNKFQLVVDHINSDQKDNRIENLRIVTHRENLSKERTVKSGLPVGVDYRKNKKKFRARIRIKGKQIFLGWFSTQEEASQAYQKELKKL